MRIAYVAKRFPQARVHAFASRWVRAGHDVAVVADRGASSSDGVRVLRLASIPSDLRAADVVIAEASPLPWAVSAWALSELLRVPFVLDVDGAPTAARWLRRRADLIVAGREEVADGIVIPEGIDVARCVPAPRDTALRDELGLGDDFVVAYLGAQPDRMLEAARELGDVRFVLVGARSSTGNVTFVPPPRPARVDRLIAAADLVVTFDREPALEIMARARPVLFVGRGDAASIVERSGAGWVVPRGDARAIVDVVREAEADPAGAWARGEIGRMHVAEHFDRDRLAEAYLAQLRRLARE